MEQVETFQGFSEETMVDEKSGKTFPAFYFYQGRTWAFKFTGNLFTVYADVDKPESNVLFQPDMMPLNVNDRIKAAYDAGLLKNKK